MALAHVPYHARELEDVRTPKRVLLRQYGNKQSAAEPQGRLFSRKKEPSETFLQYSRALRQIGIGAELEEDVYVAAFINGFATNASSILRIVKPRTLDDAVDEICQHRRSTLVFVSRGH